MATTSTLCADIVVNILNYDSAYTYTIYIRPAGSQSIPTTGVIATGPQYVFKNLTPAPYEIGVETNCPNIGKSIIVWNEPVDPNCAVPKVTYAGGTFTINPVNLAVPGWQWKADNSPWQSVPGTGAATYPLTAATINTVLNNYWTNRPNSLVNFQFRNNCSTGKSSRIVSVPVITTPVPLGKVTLIENLCKSNYHAGQILRITLGFNSAGVEDLKYHDVLGDLILGTIPRSNNLNIDITAYKNLIDGFNVIKTFDIAAPNVILAASVDFLSTISPQGTGSTGSIPCGDYAVKYEITVH